MERKIQAIENLDEKVIKIVVDAFEKAGEDVRILVLPDHPTPIILRTHSSEPVPYLLYDSSDHKESVLKYNEKDAKAGGIYIPEGHTIIDHLFEK